MTTAQIKLPAAFRRIEMELAREPAHPAGAVDERLVLIAPLDGEGRIDADLCRAYKETCRVVSEHGGETSAGHLVRGPGGQWLFRYDISGSMEDETAFRLTEERLITGEYVSVRRKDGMHTFRVVRVVPV